MTRWSVKTSRVGDSNPEAVSAAGPATARIPIFWSAEVRRHAARNIVIDFMEYDKYNMQFAVCVCVSVLRSTRPPATVRISFFLLIGDGLTLTLVHRCGPVSAAMLLLAQHGVELFRLVRVQRQQLVDHLPDCRVLPDPRIRVHDCMVRIGATYYGVYCANKLHRGLRSMSRFSDDD